MTAADHWQDVRLVQLDIKGSGMRYHEFMYLTYCYLHNFPHQWPKWEGGGLGTTIYQTQMKKKNLTWVSKYHVKSSSFTIQELRPIVKLC